MNKAYIVMKKGYEYDDNIYNETEGGHPKIVFLSKEDAQRKVKELNVEEYKQSSITEFAYEYEDCVNVEWDVFDNFNKSLVSKYGDIPKKYKWDSNENRLHPLANEEEINEYCKMVAVSFYDVLEVDIDTSSWRDSQIDSIIND
jgi:hypothetical protein